MYLIQKIDLIVGLLQKTYPMVDLRDIDVLSPGRLIHPKLSSDCPVLLVTMSPSINQMIFLASNLTSLHEKPNYRGGPNTDSYQL